MAGAPASNVDVIVLSGGIGVGKTQCMELLRAQLAENPNVHFVPEDVAAWQHYLTRMYDGSDPHAPFLLQVQVLAHYLGAASLYDQLAERARLTKTKQLLVVERSPQEVIQVFMEGGDDAMTVLRLCYELMMQKTALWASREGGPRVTWWWITCDVRRGAARILSRKREGEANIATSLLEDLNARYAAFFANRDHMAVNNDGSLADLLCTIQTNLGTERPNPCPLSHIANPK